MPNSPRNPYEEFLAKRIPGAQFLDLDLVASPHELGLKHMIPPSQVFADACENFGIESTSHVIIYDSAGVFSSPRALFMFRSYGHQKSSIINGGLPAWEAEGFTVDGGHPSKVKKTHYPIPSLESQFIRSYEQIAANSLADPSTTPDAELVLDARSRGRYLGTEPEPRLGLSSGHIPYSFSLPFANFLKTNTASNGTKYTMFLPNEDLHKALTESIGVERADSILKGITRVVTSCGSGMTAGVLWLGLKLLGVKHPSLYDESWTGYASRSSSMIKKSQ